MNFVNDRELARRFKNSAVPSRERFVYLLITSVLLSMFMSPFLILSVYPDYEALNMWDAYVDIAILTITIIGSVICYKTNKAGDDKEFIERYVCIGFPIIIQLIVAAIIVIALMVIAMASGIDMEIPDKTSAFDLTFEIMIMLYFYVRLNSSIKLAAH